jgi:uncharacterized protein (TIGR02444 family)
MSDLEASRGSPFWRFSLGFYRMAEVADTCIALQDQAGVDVNLLMFLLWNATQGRQASKTDVEGLERKIGEWRNAAVIPLREIRRRLKTPPPVVEAATAEVFRTRIKAAELEAERLQQEAMYALAQGFGAPASSSADAARVSVASYQSICPKPFPPAAVERLLAAFAKFERRESSE